MRLGWIAGGAVAVFLAFAAGAGWLPLGGGPSCAVDEAIDAPLRKGAVAASTRFFKAVIARDNQAAYAMLTPGFQQRMLPAKFDELTGAILDGAGGPFVGLKSEHAYHVTREGQAGRVICGNSETGVAVNALPGATQVHTLFSAATPSHAWALTAWMTKNADAWEVASFYVTIAGVAGRGSDELWRLGQVQAGKNNAFNAFLLLSAASATAYRGPDFQTALKPSIDAALAAQKVPPELAGNPPRTWVLGRTKYAIEQVTIVGADKDLGLVIMYRDEGWDAADDVDGETRNRALIQAFVKSRPEVQEAFGFVVARILRPGQDVGWGTVYDVKRGFTTATPAEAVAASQAAKPSETPSLEAPETADSTAPAPVQP
jgi:hypothetical protein